MPHTIDYAETFARLAADSRSEETIEQGGVAIRVVRVPAGGPGRWDSHPTTTEIVLVWRGDFKVEFPDHTIELTAGQTCVVPTAIEHRGTSPTGAEIVLFQQIT
jgi:mannose-6-phosphate isomerase-like protein (cupin superfamily)